MIINLLPKETKDSLRAARLNVILLRYAIFFGLILLATLAIFGAGYYSAYTQKLQAESHKTEMELTNEKYAKVKKEADEFASNLTIAEGILSNEVSFSDLIVEIAKTLPPGTVLSDLSLGTETAGKPMTISARTTDSEGALQSGGAVRLKEALALKDAFEKSPLFDNVSIISIADTSQADGTTSSPDPIATKYPITVTLNTTFTSQLNQKRSAN